MGLRTRSLVNVNLVLGFSTLFISASAGSFISTEISDAFIHDKAILESWQLMLKRSSHGHVALFGIIQILFGLTMNYSGLTTKIKKLQSVGLSLGVLAMGPGLLARAVEGPKKDIDYLAIILGVFLSIWLITIISHIYGLLRKGVL